MKTAKFCAELSAAGCFISRHGSNHDMWYSPITKAYFAIPRHQSKELPKGLETKSRRVLGVKHSLL